MRQSASPSTPITQVGLRDLGSAERPRRIRRLHRRLDEALVHQQFLACPGLSKRAIIATLPETVWVSFDVDALDPSLCPHGHASPWWADLLQAMIAHCVQKWPTLLGVDN